MKKKHQMNMQKLLNVLRCLVFNSVGSNEATRLKVAQPDKTSHVRTKNSGLVKSLASSTITGMSNVSDALSKKTRSLGVSNNTQASLPFDFLEM